MTRPTVWSKFRFSVVPETNVPVSPLETEIEEPSDLIASSSSAVVLLAVPFSSISAVKAATAGFSTEPY